MNGEDLVHPVADIDLPQSAVNAGYDGPRDLTWDAEHNQLLAQSDNDANTGAKIGTYEFKNGVLQLTKLTDAPDEIRTQNTEGFAITPDAEATKVVNGKVYKPVCWADDGVTNGHSLRMGYMATNQPVPTSTTINLLNFNDFHGRIDKNLTVPFAATIEQLKGEYLTHHCCCPPATISVLRCSTLRYSRTSRPSMYSMLWASRPRRWATTSSTKAMPTLPIV